MNEGVSDYDLGIASYQCFVVKGYMEISCPAFDKMRSEGTEEPGLEG